MSFQSLKPISILFIVSSSVSFLLCTDTLHFFKIFIFSTIAQIIGYNFYLKIAEIFIEKIKNERIKEFSKQGLEVTCPCYLSKKMFVPIELNAANSFNCAECSKEVSVEVTASTFMKTDMINLENADAALIEVYKKIQETEN
jgi:hypothetical protein